MSFLLSDCKEKLALIRVGNIIEINFHINLLFFSKEQSMLNSRGNVRYDQIKLTPCDHFEILLP